MALSMAAGLLLGIRFRYPAALLASLVAVVAATLAMTAQRQPLAAVAGTAVGALVALQAGYFFAAWGWTAFMRWRASRH